MIFSDVTLYEQFSIHSKNYFVSLMNVLLTENIYIIYLDLFEETARSLIFYSIRFNQNAEKNWSFLRWKLKNFFRGFFQGSFSWEKSLKKDLPKKYQKKFKTYFLSFWENLSCKNFFLKKLMNYEERSKKVFQASCQVWKFRNSRKIPEILMIFFFWCFSNFMQYFVS